jgi:hypothetical protein
MFLYLLENKTKNKKFVGLAINYTDPIKYHTERKIVPELHRDLLSGHEFECRRLANPRSLTVAENLERMYINKANPEYNV